MKKITIFALSIVISLFLVSLDGMSRGKGDKCMTDGDCGFGLTCNDGVCVRERSSDFGSSGKSGKPCRTDSDCIGSGECVKNNFGKGYCTGN